MSRSTLTNPVSRRGFLAGSTGAIVTTALGTRLALATPDNVALSDAIVVVFLRGGADALNMFAPVNDANYQAARPNLRVKPPASLANPADRLPLTAGGAIGAFPLSGQLSMHPGMDALYRGPWTKGQLAIIHGTGLASGLTTTRSHFEAQRIMEVGSTDDSQPGFLNGFVAGLGTVGKVASVGKSGQMQRMLGGPAPALAVGNPKTFGVTGFQDNAKALGAIASMHARANASTYAAMAQRTIDGIGVVQSVNWSGLTPQNSAPYLGTDKVDDRFKEVAAMLRAGVGLRAAAIDMDGWDTHNAQGNPADPSSSLRVLVNRLSRALNAFSVDLGAKASEVTVVVMSEFGRTIKENGSGGTDHGRGGAMMVMGPNIKGGVYGSIASPLVADSGSGDLAVTTDYRQVLHEVFTVRGGLASTTALFKGFSPTKNLGFAKP